MKKEHIRSISEQHYSEACEKHYDIKDLHAALPAYSGFTNCQKVFHWSDGV